MKIDLAGRSCDLAYCLNIHPGETWEENLGAIRELTPLVQAGLDQSHRPFGLGLRLGNRAAGEFLALDAAPALLDLLAENNQYVFTINGFPFGGFHGKRIKEDVYRPDWRSRERIEYTIKLARILGLLLPEGHQGSISTMPGSYRDWAAGSAADHEQIAGNLAEVAGILHLISEETGRDIHLGLEPEPDCLLESTADCVSFFTRVLDRWATPRLARAAGVDKSSAADILRRRLGVCFDSCHLATRFEDLEESARELAGAGIRISKAQLSAALKAPAGEPAAGRLADFINPVYLQQVKTRRADGSIHSSPDLAGFLAARPGKAVDGEWRVHCHVPLYMPPEEHISTTADVLTPGLLKTLADCGARHFEIETYTWGVLPGATRRTGVVESIVDEYRWLCRHAKLQRDN